MKTSPAASAPNAHTSASEGMMMTFQDVPNYRPTMNVLDIEVPWQLEQTRDLGVAFANDLFGGQGATPSSVTLFTGTPGAGKSTLSQQLADACTGKDHVVLYNSGEESLFQVRKQAKRLGLKAGFIPSAHRKTEDIFKHLDMLRELHPTKQVILVLDSLATTDDGYYKDGFTNGATTVRVAKQVVEYCKRTYAIAILIGQVTKDGKLAGKNQLLHAVDAHMHLFIDEAAKSETKGMRIIRMNKNRFGSAGISHVLEMTATGLQERGQYGGSADLGGEDSE
jgi:DNA repair protein RadA/Sms